MSNTIYHIHHIVPRHMGGTDDPSNLVKLTVEEHAEAHRELYEKYGRLEDKLAWKMLEGQAMMGENLLMKSKLGWKKANENGAVCKGRKWYYNPENPSERKMIRDGDIIPNGWQRGRGKNTWAKNRDYKKTADEQRQKVSKKTCVDGIIYNSGKEAAESLGVTPAAISWMVKTGKAYHV